jgi:hypothetical protein
MNPPLDAVSQALVLAAVERALRHNPGMDGVPVWTILSHLDLTRRSARARRVKDLLSQLSVDGLLVSLRRHGVPVWKLSEVGRGSLQAAGPQMLSESPQYRRWREAHTRAEQELESLRIEMGDVMLETFFMLGPSERPSSDAWFDLAVRLKRAARRVGSATHCLYEWPEPGEEYADIDTHKDLGDRGLEPHERRRLIALRAGRRNVSSWRSD